jgi:hypothetical protein
VPEVVYELLKLVDVVGAGPVEMDVAMKECV